ncbi:hypothetical protein [Rhizobium sp. S152]|uniref:hypothetical protein n=1 Tax=Rhizobium sp. S152 TaxID=3055038 RepID=UPI0030143D5D
MLHDPAEASATETRTRSRFLIVLMLFAVTVVNYADRATISIVEPASRRISASIL